MADATVDQRENVQDRQQGLQSAVLYDVVQLLSRQAPDDPLMQDARTLVNALNPARFTFDGAHPIPQPVPTPTPLIYAIDVSSAQGMDIGALIDLHKPNHVICKSYQQIELGGRGAAYTIAQAQGAAAKGCTVGYYIWLYADIDGVRQAASGLEPLKQLGATPAVVWLDCETYTDGSGPDADVIRAAVAEVRRQGFAPGIYTGKWWWNAYTMRGSTEFKDLPLWASIYDGRAEMVDVDFGGWQRLAGKQWSGSPIDRSVFHAEFA